MLPDSLIHTDLNEKNEPMQMVVHVTRKELDRDFKEIEVSSNDDWDEEVPEDYPPAVAAEILAPVENSLVEVVSPHVWSLYRVEIA